jgi:aldehyde dehydrogenase (NAD+)
MQEVVCTLRYYSGWADKVAGRTVSNETNTFSYTLVEPVGVVAIIVAWNFPLMVAILKWSAGKDKNQFFLPSLILVFAI